MPAPRTKSDGFVRGWHPDQRAGLPAGNHFKKCKHPAEHREELTNSNGDKIVHCQLCDAGWWELA